MKLYFYWLYRLIFMVKIKTLSSYHDIVEATPSTLACNARSWHGGRGGVRGVLHVGLHQFAPVSFYSITIISIIIQARGMQYNPFHCIIHQLSDWYWRLYASWVCMHACVVRKRPAIASQSLHHCREMRHNVNSEKPMRVQTTCKSDS